jgi:hypothetical protein
VTQRVQQTTTKISTYCGHVSPALQWPGLCATTPAPLKGSEPTEYDGFEYAALPVDYSGFLITLCCNIFHLRTARR